MRKIVYQGGSGEITEKKSRFIATVIPVKEEQEALDFIASTKKKYWDARHNCFAYIIGENAELVRCSDDGEPAGTAGRPMLEVLEREGLCNLAVVVTRYFGGVLLGTGGLVRAYQGATKEGLSECTIIEPQLGFPLVIKTDYNGYGRVEYLLREEGLAIDESEFTDVVSLKVSVPSGKRASLDQALADATGGKAILTWGEEISFAYVDGGLVVF